MAVEAMRSYYIDVSNSWKEIPALVQDDTWLKFKTNYYVWNPSFNEHQMRRCFNKKADDGLKCSLYDARQKGQKLNWMYDVAWTRLNQYWAYDEFAKKSAQGKAARAFEMDGLLYTCGSVSMGTHQMRLQKLKNDDSESESVSEAGDIGDRELQSNRYSGSGRLRFIGENVPEHHGKVVVPVTEFDMLEFGPLQSGDLNATTTASPVTTEHKNNDEKIEVPWMLEYASCLLFLAVFGILGVLLRYGLQKLFGPGIVGATNDQSYMYLDLPSNMLGSFLMGWFGVVFKEDISRFSNQLAIGLTTGFLGSLTTFSGWNQIMLDLSVEGHWVFVVLGYLIGLFLVAYSIIFGIETAKGVKWLYRSAMNSSNSGNDYLWRVDSCKRHLIVLPLLLFILASLWGMSISLEMTEFSSGSTKAQLWLACIVGPFGVWIRWFLARLNGRGLGKWGLLKWVPFGTLIANVSAACVMAALATLKKAVKTQTCDTIASGIQFGLLGCLSTVSTFIAEFHAMGGSKHPWRAYAYTLCTMLISFILGTFVYSMPVWIENFS